MASSSSPVVEVDLCIVGAGIAGLNAAYVASQYLPASARIAIVDRHDDAGGMWTDAYDYVRLHQPHPVFTVGDLPWTAGQPPQHLATRVEVLAHLRECLQEIRARIAVTTYFGHEFVSAQEDAAGVDVVCRTPGGEVLGLRATHLIDATSTGIQPLDPFGLTSKRVHSLTAQRAAPTSSPLADDGAPIWVVGSGKTGMDTAQALISAFPGREVNLIAGTGTFFLDRDKMFPPGRSTWAGTRPNKMLTGLADRFDGTNEDAALAWLRETHGTSPLENAEHFFIGALSAREATAIRNGLRTVVRDHLVDAVDDGATVELRLRSGAHVTTDPGSSIINCTSHFSPEGRESGPPYVSPGGRMIAVGTIPVFGFSSFTAYFLTHLLYAGKIRSVPLYTIDGLGLLRHCPPAAVVSFMVLSQYNLGLAFDALPMKVFQQWGLDFDRLYPLPRQLAGQAAFVVGHRRKRASYRRALATVGERFGVDHGPLAHVTDAAG